MPGGSFGNRGPGGGFRGGAPGGGMRGPGGMPPGGGFGGPGMTPPPRRRRGSCLGSILAFIVVLVIIVAAMASSIGGGRSTYAGSQTSSQTSTIQRDKLESGNAYINDCIEDELGWFDNISKTEGRLKNFWEETGVQPYIILRDYDASLTTNAEKEQWAIDYYDANFDTENIFLFVYFAEQDSDNDVGYMAYANGKQTSSVMDSEAVEIFWNNIDKYWYSDASTDDLFVNAFNDTADTIMHVSTTGKDILKWVLIVIAIIAVGVIIINLVKQKNKRAKEKAEEDQRILETPIHDIADDNLENKYL
jgi:hypothetical protein